MKEVKYKQGMTKVWSDGEKVIITNDSSRDYIEENVDRIFGLGEYQKIYEVKYSDMEVRGQINPHSKSIQIISGYIPDRVKEDLDIKSLPGIKGEDLMGEYFK